jgi:hypothetical protein
VAGPLGELVRQLGQKPGLLLADLDLQEIRTARTQVPVLTRNTGEVTGDGRLQVEGRVDEVVSNVKQTGEKAEDAFRGRGTRRREYRVQGF